MGWREQQEMKRMSDVIDLSQARDLAQDKDAEKIVKITTQGKEFYALKKNVSNNVTVMPVQIAGRVLPHVINTLHIDNAQRTSLNGPEKISFLEISGSYLFELLPEPPAWWKD